MERHSIHYGENCIAFAIVRRERTTLEIAVEPDASVVVAAPQNATLSAIEEKVRKRAAWIRRSAAIFRPIPAAQSGSPVCGRRESSPSRPTVSAEGGAPHSGCGEARPWVYRGSNA